MTPVRQCVAVRHQCVNAPVAVSASVRQCVYRDALHAHCTPSPTRSSRHLVRQRTQRRGRGVQIAAPLFSARRLAVERDACTTWPQRGFTSWPSETRSLVAALMLLQGMESARAVFQRTILDAKLADDGA